VKEEEKEKEEEEVEEFPASQIFFFFKALKRQKFGVTLKCSYFSKTMFLSMKITLNES